MRAKKIDLGKLERVLFGDCSIYNDVVSRSGHTEDLDSMLQAIFELCNDIRQLGVDCGIMYDPNIDRIRGMCVGAGNYRKCPLYMDG